MASKLEDFTEELKCPICLEIFTDPVTTECGHNYCRSCITRSLENQKGICPVCKKNSPEGKLAVNWGLTNLAEKAQKRSLYSTEMEIKRNCEKHQMEPLKLFCEIDNKLICSVCKDETEHRDHSILDIDKAAKIYKDQVKSSLGSLSKRKETAEQAEDKQRQKILEVEEQVRILQGHIVSEYAEIHKRLTGKEQVLMEVVKREEKKILHQMETNLQRILDKFESFKYGISELQKQMKKDTLTFLQEEIGRRRRISDEDFELSVCEERLPGTIYREMIDSISSAQSEKINQMESAREQESHAHQQLIDENRLGKEKIDHLKMSLTELWQKLSEEKEAMTHKLQEQQCSLRQEFHKKSEEMEQQIRAKDEEIKRATEKEAWLCDQREEEQKCQKAVNIETIDTSEEAAKSPPEERKHGPEIRPRGKGNFQLFIIVLILGVLTALAVYMFAQGQHEKMEHVERVREEETRAHKQLVELKRLRAEKIRHLEMALEEERLQLMEEQKAIDRKLQEQKRSLRQEFQEKPEEVEVQIKDQFFPKVLVGFLLLLGLAVLVLCLYISYVVKLNRGITAQTRDPDTAQPSLNPSEELTIVR